MAPSKVAGIVRGDPIPPELLLLARKSEYLAELKSAYLIAFAVLGYTFILDPKLDPIRDSISNGSLSFQPCMVQEEGSWAAHRVWVIGGQFASV
ncbi:MAG: hypothetical protein AAF531_28255, partial [Actinomycetota bacterium]